MSGPPSYNPYISDDLRYEGDTKKSNILESTDDLHDVPEVGGHELARSSGQGINREASSKSSVPSTMYMDGSDSKRDAPRFPEADSTSSYPFAQKLTSQMGPEDSQDGLIQSRGNRSSRYQDLEYSEPNFQDSKGVPAPVPQRSGPLAKFFDNARYPLEQRIENKKRGIGIQKYPIVVWTVAAALVGVFIYELVLNARQQGTPISLKPSINPMLGPSGSALIFLGARFPPCMKSVTDVPLTLAIGCMNNTQNPVTEICTIGDLCGFGGIPSGQEPNQWFRFIVPIFLHAGIIHILLNLLAQLSLSAQIEREMGSGGFFLVYFSAGIFGNVLGGNFALVGVPSVGASGAIFGSLAVTWVDLVAHWRYHYRPVRRLVFMTLELLIGIAVGFIPYVDNFAHLGGFLMGLLVGTVVYPVISPSKRHRLIMWAFRLAAIPLAIVLFVVLTRNFYTSDPYAACAGCRYLSCIPTAANNRCKGTGLTTTSTTST